MRRYLCLYFPRWPIQCLRRNRPETAGQALAVFERTAYGPVVIVCSVEASRLGIKSGMSVTDARALVPELLLHEADFAGDQAQLEELCCWSIRFSPLIGIETVGVHVSRPQALFLDTTGCEQVFHGEDKLFRQALGALYKQGFEVRGAMAPTLGAAWAIAHFGIRKDASKFDLVPNDSAALRAALEPLPLPSLRLDGETLAYLFSLGLRTIGELLRQPRSALPSRFGPALIERMDQALGVAPERMTPFFPAPEYRVAWSFEYPIRSTEILLPIIDQMVAKIVVELQQAHRGARHMECWIFHEVATPVRVKLKLHRSSANATHLCKLLRISIEDALRAPNAAVLKSRRARKNGARKSFSVHTYERSLDVEEGVCAAALHVVSSEALRDLQLSLFERGAEETFSGGLAALLDGLVSRLGPAAVLRTRLEDAILPEQAVRFLTLEQHAAQAASRAVSGSVSRERPLKLLREPVRLAMKDLTEFAVNGHGMTIQCMSGPERIETAWWQERDVRRDYYIAETTSGSKLWLFQSLRDGAWFLHGTFD